MRDFWGILVGVIGIVGTVVGMIGSYVICEKISHRSRKISEEKETKDGLTAEQRRKLEEQLADNSRILLEYERILDEVIRRVEQLENSKERTWQGKSLIQSQETESRFQKEILPYPKMHEHTGVENANLSSEETEIKWCINTWLKEQTGTITDYLKTAGYPIEKQIEISSSAKIMSDMELPVMSENSGGIIGIIPVSGKNDEYYALPTTRRIPKSLLIGGAFKYLFEWKNTDGAVGSDHNIAIIYIEKIPKVAYKSDIKGYQLIKGTKGLVVTEN